MVDAYILQGRLAAAEELFGRLVALCNDVGLLAEEYDTVNQRLVGNFPQAFSHIALVNSAFNLTQSLKPVEQRRDGHTSHPDAAVPHERGRLEKALAFFGVR